MCSIAISHYDFTIFSTHRGILNTGRTLSYEILRNAMEQVHWVAHVRCYSFHSERLPDIKRM